MSEDPSRKEVSVRAALTGSSLSIAVRSRAVSVLDRLLGGLIGIPAAWLERYEERIRNRVNRESIIQEAAAFRIKSAIENDDKIPQVVADIALSSSLMPVINKLRVVEIAIEQLSGNAAKNEAIEDEQDTGDVDQDWLNYFSSYAERASSEDIRHIWARVLAGEIRRTGSFSLSSLRLLSELDQKMATTYQNAVEYRLNGNCILKPKKEEMKGEFLLSLAFLEEVGLLQSIGYSGGMVQKFQPNSDGLAYVQEQNLCLVMKVQNFVELRVIRLTRSGREIAGILPPADPLKVLDRIGAAILDQVDSAEIRQITGGTRTEFSTRLIKTLKREQ
ncbi:MAG: DUF2806 domain-containing protein [Acidiferrobacterales bacterium]|nr:DUF2806 domain-containing protein [Acidiferrobacterales bacterium]